MALGASVQAADLGWCADLGRRWPWHGVAGETTNHLRLQSGVESRLL